LLVIAHALDCNKTRAEWVRLLGDEGLSPLQTDEVTTHLASGALDALEARLVPLARESVRYKPIAIQGRVREVAAGMEPRAILDVIGAAAVGNALARVGTLA
jgi:hypothetical protein